MIELIAEEMGVGPHALGFGASLTPPASAVVSALTDQPVELVRPLMESLERELLPRDGGMARLYGIEPRALRTAPWSARLAKRERARSRCAAR